ncbi:hypothetical protein TrispH2_011298 [Trichoplax sp. H2]|nr:hypothetical protein TrispH2_011298 [Trichoplax sp. H2]|eukprot:RDD36798.1 hypothetical protein TrispH2_011298 [Trichoplax sp. H2]
MVLWVEGRVGAIHIVQFPFSCDREFAKAKRFHSNFLLCVCIRTVNKGGFPPCLSMDKLTKFEQFINEKLKGDLTPLKIPTNATTSNIQQHPNRDGHHQVFVYHLLLLVC